MPVTGGLAFASHRVIPAPDGAGHGAVGTPGTRVAGVGGAGIAVIAVDGGVGASGTRGARVVRAGVVVVAVFQPGLALTLPAFTCWEDRLVPPRAVHVTDTVGGGTAPDAVGELIVDASRARGARVARADVAVIARYRGK